MTNPNSNTDSWTIPTINLYDFYTGQFPIQYSPIPN